MRCFNAPIKMKWLLSGVTVILGADGGDSEREHDVVPWIALITGVRREYGARVGRKSLSREGPK